MSFMWREEDLPHDVATRKSDLSWAKDRVAAEYSTKVVPATNLHREQTLLNMSLGLLRCGLTWLDRQPTQAEHLKKLSRATNVWQGESHGFRILRGSEFSLPVLTAEKGLPFVTCDNSSLANQDTRSSVSLVLKFLMDARQRRFDFQYSGYLTRHGDLQKLNELIHRVTHSEMTLSIARIMPQYRKAVKRGSLASKVFSKCADNLTWLKDKAALHPDKSETLEKSVKEFYQDLTTGIWLIRMCCSIPEFSLNPTDIRQRGGHVPPRMEKGHAQSDVVGRISEDSAVCGGGIANFGHYAVHGRNAPRCGDRSGGDIPSQDGGKCNGCAA
jgi:hypothetical protein